MAPNNRKTKAGVLAMLAVAAAALLSGCAGLGDDEGNRAPQASLEADRDSAWAGEEFTFDAQSSSDPDGDVAEWRFDFGDGTTATVTDDDAARVKHAYTRGGEYIVTVTVVDDGDGEGLGERTDEDAVHVAVDERMPVAATVVRNPVDDAGSSLGLPFQVNEGADRAVANLTLQNTLPTGSSRVTLRLHDPSGDVIEEESYTLDSSEPQDVEFSSLLVDDVGNHTLEVVADSGSARVTGELQVLYSDAPDLDKLKDQADDEA